jgi:hypothetical protein
VSPFPTERNAGDHPDKRSIPFQVHPTASRKEVADPRPNRASTLEMTLVNSTRTIADRCQLCKIFLSHRTRTIALIVVIGILSIRLKSRGAK